MADDSESPKELLKKIAQLTKELDESRKIINERDAVISDLDDYVRRLLHWRFGRRTEKSNDPQEIIPELQELIDMEDTNTGRPLLIDTSQLKDGPTDDTSSSSGRGEPPLPREGKGRRKLSEMHPNLPVDEEIVSLPESELFDADGYPLTVVGRETKEELVKEPGRFRIRRIIRLRYGRSDTGEKVCTAPVPDAIVNKGILANITVLQIVILHCIDCLPFNRISEQFGRDGVTIGRQTITCAFHHYAKLAEPLMGAMEAQLMQSNMLHVDGTFLYQQDRTRRRSCKRSPLYGITDGQQLLLRWKPDEKYETAADLLPGFSGYLVHDEWDGWQWLKNTNLTHVGCNAHARRFFAQAQDSDKDGEWIVRIYQKIYAVEHMAQESGLTGEALANHRLELRKKFSVTYMDELLQAAEEIAKKATGAKATKARYIIKHKEDLRRFLTDGHLPPDNNLAERVLRRSAMLRRNRFFFVADNGGENLAIAMSITGSCRLLGIDPLAYMEFALEGLFAYRRAEKLGLELPDLTPYTPLSFAQSMGAQHPGVKAA